MTKPYILGFSYSHNGAVCLLHGDEIVVAVQEERITRIKRDWLPPLARSCAVQYCLDSAGITAEDLSMVVGATKGMLLTDARREELILPGVSEDKLVTIPHYLAHATGCFATSGLEEAAILVTDGLGEFLPSLKRDYASEIRDARYANLPRSSEEVNWGEILGIYHAKGTEVELLEKHLGCSMLEVEGQRMANFGSLGGLFECAADLIFGEPLNAGKVMGLAPYGKLRDQAEDILQIDSEGVLHFFDHIPRKYSQYDEVWPANQEVFADLSCGLQNALEVVLRAFWKRTQELTGSERFCYSGGVALNSVANEKLIRQRFFQEHFISPAAEDSGLAVGAAYHGLWALTGKNNQRRIRKDETGRRYGAAQIDTALATTPFVRAESCKDVPAAIATALADGEIIGLFEGGSELGPRALGQRSILCDPRRQDAKEILNARVKHREGFRPFAPVILEDLVEEWFESVPGESKSPYMLRVFDFKDAVKDRVPGVVHVDGTGRVQTVNERDNGLLYSVVRAFHDRTGVPIVLNTSFNVMGEPIVERPEDALWCALFSDMDAVAFADRMVRKIDSFSSILDYRPTLTVRKSKISGNHEAQVYGYVRQSPWGPHEVWFRGDAAALLLRCDGTRSGHELRLEMEELPWTELRMLRALGKLRRADIIEFKS